MPEGRRRARERCLRNRGNARRATSRPITPHPSFSTWDWSTRWGTTSSTPLPCAAVSRRDAFLHDGRARSLEDVFRKEHHPRGLVLTPAEIADLVAFLETL